MILFVLLFSQILSAEVKLCLVMGVKDDEATILSCLNSVKGIIDALAICDLGAADNTLALIEQFMEENNIRGKICSPMYISDPSYRMSTQLAQEAVKEWGFSPADTYLLALDPYMVLNIGSSFNKDNLTEDAYLLLEKSTLFSLYNYNLHIFRSDITWQNRGTVYADWICQNQVLPTKLHTLAIEDPRDDVAKEKHLQSNLEALSQAVIDEPMNVHHLFYLAQTYKCLKYYDQAIKCYKARIEKPESREEVWFSKYMLGECYQELGSWEDTVYWYLEAYQTNPARTESLCKLATHYRLFNKNDLAYLFARHGSRLPYPDDPILMPIPHLFEYQFDEELSIAAYYTPFAEEGYTAADEIILRKKVPWWVKNQAYKNILFYTPNLPKTEFKSIQFHLPLIRRGTKKRYYPMNPTILKTDDGYRVICRSVNYKQSNAVSYTPLEPISRTKNFLLHYDRNFSLLSQHEIVEDLPRDKYPNGRLEGLEDCRIFSFGHSLWFSCTTVDTNPLAPQISLCKLSPTPSDKTIRVESLTPLQGPDSKRCEKNWLPFVKNGELYFLYSCDPFVLYKPDIKTGVCKMAFCYHPAHDFSRFRGSASPIAFNDGYLMIVHEAVDFFDRRRCYLHRFVYLDRDFLIKQISKPFTFQHQGIEFCCGMTMDHSETKLILSIGIEDREACLCFVDCETVRSLLTPLPALPPHPSPPKKN